MAKVSIIVPIYNSGKYLKKCLDSIINQTLEDIEIILVDDNSTDNSLEIARYYEKNDPRIKVINIDENKGPGFCRNVGIASANSKYIGFVDSDDYIDSEMYKKLFTNAIRNNVEIATCDANKMFLGINHGKEISEKEKTVIIPKEASYYLTQVNVACWNKIFKHDYIDNFYFSESLKYEDYPFTIKAIGNANKIYILREPLYFHRERLDSLSHLEYKELDSHILDIFRCNDDIRSYYINNGLISIYQYALDNLFILHSMYHCSNILTVNMNRKDKKRLISNYVKYVELEYGDVISNRRYIEEKEKNPFFNKKVELIEKICDSNYVDSDDREEILETIKELILKNSRTK